MARGLFDEWRKTKPDGTSDAMHADLVNEVMGLRDKFAAQVGM